MRRPSTRLFLLAAATAVSLAGAANAGPVRPGEQQGLGLVGADVPDILKKAKADTYAPPAEPVCQSLPAELDALNEVLGPDADQPGLKTNRVGKLMGGAVRGLIPHRDVIRFITGAGKKDEALKEAAMAGWARRGYLKGLAKTLDCSSPKVAAADAAAAPAAAVAPQPAETPAEPPAAPPAEPPATPVIEASVPAEATPAPPQPQ